MKIQGILRDSVLAVLALPGVAGCDPTDPGPGLEAEATFVPVTCDGGRYDYLAGVVPNEPFDYLELRHRGATSPLFTRGERCSGATDRAACNQAAENTVSQDGFYFNGDFAQVLRTSGDQIELIVSPERLTELIVPVESPGDALLVMKLEGYDVRCSGSGTVERVDGYAVQGYTYPGCDGITRVISNVATDGAVTVKESAVLQEADDNCVVGRRPAGLSRTRTTRHDVSTLAGYLCRAAEFEAASVAAFRELEGELRYHRAPRALIRAARRAARDEARHARVVGRLARKFGASPKELPVERRAPRALAELALDNMVEGCVLETYAALVAQWQAATARDPDVAHAYGRIGRDEANHSALSWKVHGWLMPKLDRGTRQRVLHARDATVAAVERELERAVPAEPSVRAGVPSSRQARALFAALRERLLDA